jgi:uncharacterized membrane protein YphA (DoxX/SURF4 family)
MPARPDRSATDIFPTPTTSITTISTRFFNVFTAKHDRSTPLTIYCEGISGAHNEDTCSTSRLLAEFMMQAGYKNATLYEEGIAFWEKAGYPLEKGTGAGRAEKKRMPLINYGRDFVMLLIGCAALFFLRNRGAIIAIRLLLGTIFLISASTKLLHADQLEVILEAYKIVPLNLLPFAAACVPWVELFAGAALVSMTLSSSGALIIAGMNLFFIPALSYRALNLSQQLGVSLFGVDFDCGCGLGENFAWVLILRDVGFLLMAVAIVAASVKLFRAKTQASE